MSLSSRERANPPPRRKSCAACTKAKRRCDFAVPSCLRCSQRNLECQYPQRSTGSKPTETGSLNLSTQGGIPTTCHPSQLAGGGGSFGCKPSLLSAQFGSLPIEPLSNTIDTMTLTSAADIVDVSCMDLSDLTLPGCVLMDSELLELIHQPSMLAAPTTRNLRLDDIVARRLQFAIDEMKRAPVLMITETQTPWCHPLLYKDGMPKSVQDAHASCALYLAKNRLNGPVIFSAIEKKVQDLLSSPPPSTFLEVLAHTHSLVLYQIIRLFDGDITARAAAERHIPELEESAMNLLAYTRFDIDSPIDADGNPTIELPLYPLAPTKAFWSDWILQESARRTTLFAFFFLQTYRLLAGHQGLQCDGKLGLCHSWSMSAHLWMADTPVQFATAWKDKNHFVVTDAQFGQVLAEAKAADVDRFGRMWISALLGIEEAEGWFMARGGGLRDFC